MSSSHPTQAGKFRPVKPKPKPILPPPVATTTTTSTATATSGTTSAVPVSNNNHTNNKNSSKNRNNRFTGGTADGKRIQSASTSSSKTFNRFVIPKGEVFFTAGSAASSQSNHHHHHSGGGDGRTKTAVGPSRVSKVGGNKNQRLKNESEEIIVGTVDDGEGVGDAKNVSSVTASTSRDSSSNRTHAATEDDYISGNNNNSIVKGDNHLYTYDSSSSQDNNDDDDDGDDDDEDTMDRRQATTRKDRSTDYSQPLSVRSNASVRSLKKKTPYQPTTTTSSSIPDPSTSSTPMAEGNILHELNPYSQEWILFKLPTRLPDLEKSIQQQESVNTTTNTTNTTHASLVSESVIPIPVLSSSSTTTATNQGDAEIIVAEDIVPSQSDQNVLSKSTIFDDSFKGSKAGRYGKIVIHKSGKAYFIIGGNCSSNDGETNKGNNIPSVRMSLTNGLSCHFLQQAVTIDLDQGTYIPMGEVSKSFTVTPEL